MKLNRVKLLIAALFVLPLMASVFNTKSVVTIVSANAANVAFAGAAETYKAKCALCHKANAEKSFDTAKTDAEHVEVILKGKKGEKPPFMPGFEAKGMTAAEAQELVTYMRELRKPAN